MKQHQSRFTSPLNPWKTFSWRGSMKLIFQHETKETFFKRSDIHQCSETEVSATVYGEPANFDKHEVYTEIKSVTYHQLQVVQKPDGSWFAQVIFDL